MFHGNVRPRLPPSSDRQTRVVAMSFNEHLQVFSWEESGALNLGHVDPECP